MKELTVLIKDDGQLRRTIWNYFGELYDEIKGLNISEYQPIMEDRIQFYEFCRDTFQMMIDNCEELKIDGEYDSIK